MDDESMQAEQIHPEALEDHGEDTEVISVETLEEYLNGSNEVLLSGVEDIVARHADEVVQAGEDDYQALALRTEQASTAGVVTIDPDQWEAIRMKYEAGMDMLRASNTLSFFLVAVVAIMLGAKLWTVFAEGIRHG